MVAQVFCLLRFELVSVCEYPSGSCPHSWMGGIASHYSDGFDFRSGLPYSLHKTSYQVHLARFWVQQVLSLRFTNLC